jgi:hypothetical protein
MRQFLLVVFLCYMLVGCDNYPMTYDYLMQHPKILQKKAFQCQTTMQEDLQCVEINRIASEFGELLADYENDPEEYGLQILTEQQALFVLKQKMDAEGANQELKAQYKKQDSKVRNLLAVIGSIPVW